MHTLIAVVDLVGLGYVWVCALSRRRNSLLRVSVGLENAEDLIEDLRSALETR